MLVEEMPYSIVVRCLALVAEGGELVPTTVCKGLVTFVDLRDSSNNRRGWHLHPASTVEGSALGGQAALPGSMSSATGPLPPAGGGVSPVAPKSLDSVNGMLCTRDAVPVGFRGFLGQEALVERARLGDSTAMPVTGVAGESESTSLTLGMR